MLKAQTLKPKGLSALNCCIIQTLFLRCYVTQTRFFIYMSKDMKKVNYLFLFIFVLPFRYMLIEPYTSFDQIIIGLLTAK